MNLLKLLGADPIGMAEGIANVIDKFVETPEEKAAAEIIRTKIQQKPDEWQAKINQIEAAHRSIFVAGWRPFIGWICGIGLTWAFIGQPVVEVVLKCTDVFIEMPDINTSELLTLVFALLGLSGVRTYEKKHGLTK